MQWGNKHLKRGERRARGTRHRPRKCKSRKALLPAPHRDRKTRPPLPQGLSLTCSAKFSALRTGRRSWPGPFKWKSSCCGWGGRSQGIVHDTNPSTKQARAHQLSDHLPALMTTIKRACLAQFFILKKLGGFRLYTILGVKKKFSLSLQGNLLPQAPK